MTAAFTDTSPTETATNTFAGTKAITAPSPAVERIYNVLFLCTGNDERSLMAEALLNFVGGGKFWAYSAGPAPALEADPRAIDVLREARIPCGGLWPKNWERFLKASAPRMDLVVSLCPYVPYGVIPSFPGNPDVAFWPVKVPNFYDRPASDHYAALNRTLREIEDRVISLNAAGILGSATVDCSKSPLSPSTGTAITAHEKAAPSLPRSVSRSDPLAA
jgi:arsenate reductase